jgi:hypothetical protein
MNTAPSKYIIIHTFNYAIKSEHTILSKIQDAKKFNMFQINIYIEKNFNIKIK